MIADILGTSEAVTSLDDIQEFVERDDIIRYDERGGEFV